MKTKHEVLIKASLRPVMGISEKDDITSQNRYGVDVSAPDGGSFYLIGMGRDKGDKNVPKTHLVPCRSDYKRRRISSK